MTIVLGEWGLTTESAELENGKLIYAWSGCWEPETTSREDVVHVCASTWKVLSIKDRVKLKYNITEQAQKQV